MSTGALASLRRGTRFDVARQSAFYAVAVDVPEYQLAADAIQRWAALAQCIAITGPLPGMTDSDGGALAHARLSDSRFSRLLASHGEGLFDQLLLLARFVKSKNVALTWKDLGAMALADGSQEMLADAARLRLARDYYRSRAV